MTEQKLSEQVAALEKALRDERNTSTVALHLLEATAEALGVKQAEGDKLDDWSDLPEQAAKILAEARCSTEK